MADSFIDIGGVVVVESSLKLRRSREVVGALRARDDRYSRLIECRTVVGSEVVIVELDVERPLRKAAAIKAVERVALVFEPSDERHPQVLSLRADFPRTLHLLQQVAEYPRSLCLYDEPWSEVRLGWNAPAFIERIRWWLAGTAKGSLHGGDQPNEAFILGYGLWLIVPHGLTETITPCNVRSHDGQSGVVMALKSDTVGADPTSHCLLRVQSPPRPHGTSPRGPVTLQDLCELVRMSDFDLLSALRAILKDWPDSANALLKTQVILLLELPSAREAGGAPTGLDRKAFCLGITPLELGVAIGVWGVRDGKRAICLPFDQTATGSTVRLEIANVTESLSLAAASWMNGRQPVPPVKTLVVGAGALGSQVVSNLARAGFGSWTIVDDDVILPHNLARHALDGLQLGVRKAQALVRVMNTMFETPVAKAIYTDVLAPGEAVSKLDAAFAEAELLLDCSASVAVGRYLVHKPEGGRRISVFLSPSGRDLILLREDRARSKTLDLLEMSYYGAIASDERLQGHMDYPAGRLRYGLSCRDVTSQIAQADVGMFAGIAARAILNESGDTSAAIRIWRSDPATGDVRTVPMVTEEWHVRLHGEWACYVSNGVLCKVAHWRRAKLPAETGGILMGHVDYEARRVYVITALPAPADSIERRSMFLRGTEGMPAAVQAIESKTNGQVGYLGEWHSHPPGYPTLPSDDDVEVLREVQDHVGTAGHPGLMLIAGEDGRARLFAQVCDRLVASEELCPL